MHIQSYLHVDASRSGAFQGEFARSAEEDFAERIQQVVAGEGKVSDCGVDSEDPNRFNLHAIVWREVDSPWAKSPHNTPDETKAWLKEKAELIKKALENFQDIRIVLAITSTIEEVIE